jgi:hypothetical protein
VTTRITPRARRVGGNTAAATISSSPSEEPKQNRAVAAPGVTSTWSSATPVFAAISRRSSRSPADVRTEADL